ncbi:MAG: tail fiber domain-containing protein, partial [Limisphaerales bacterium]
EASAGQIGYGTHSGGVQGSLDIVGAGTAVGNRNIRMWAEGGLTVNGHVANGLNVHTGFGRTFEVPANYIQVLSHDNKSKASGLWRGNANGGSGDGLYLWLIGPSHHSSENRNALWNGDSNWDFSSDRRLKKDIEDAEPMLDRALKVQMRRFRWKTDAATDGLKLGVIAQELQPLFPDMVTEMAPTPGGDGLTTLAVGYSDFGMVAVKALQEFKTQHDAEVGALKSETAELKAQVADLKAQMADVIRLNAELRNRLEPVTAVANR